MVVLQTSSILAPLVFLPCFFSNSKRNSRSSVSHCRATLYRDEGAAYVGAETSASEGMDKSGVKGQGVGSVTNSPKRM
jgi:hypothetical protein